MTATTPSARLTVPELGPSLGRLVAPPPAPSGAPAHWIALDDLRLGLVTHLFELAGDARRWVQEGDRELALATLNREAWLAAWQRAVSAVAERAAEAIGERLMAAAAEARLPARRARALPLDPDEIAELASRLNAGVAPLDQALRALDVAAHTARSERAPAEAVAEWQAALEAAARRVEAAWLALEEALGREWHEWHVEVEELRTWRRPLWPLVVAGGAVMLLAAYLGLVLGGYLPVPGPLRGMVEAIWARWS
jgi:hypothetical protein